MSLEDVFAFKLPANHSDGHLDAVRKAILPCVFDGEEIGKLLQGVARQCPIELESMVLHEAF